MSISTANVNIGVDLGTKTVLMPCASLCFDSIKTVLMPCASLCIDSINKLELHRNDSRCADKPNLLP